jgi:small subunit ribosomal protein S3
MGHKVDPRAYRLGISKDWLSRYFVRKGLAQFLEEDLLIRETIKDKLGRVGIESIEIERTSNDAISIKIKSSRPGLIIGRGGSGVEDLKKTLEKNIKKLRERQKKANQKFTISLTVEEVRNPETSAKIVAENIAMELEKRVPFRRAIKQALSRVMQSKDVKGCKIMVSGRLDGAEIARTEWISEGKIPLVTLRSDIDFAHDEAYCTYGVVGVKVWIYKGEKFKEKDAVSKES